MKTKFPYGQIALDALYCFGGWMLWLMLVALVLGSTWVGGYFYQLTVLYFVTGWLLEHGWRVYLQAILKEVQDQEP